MTNLGPVFQAIFMLISATFFLLFLFKGVGVGIVAMAVMATIGGYVIVKYDRRFWLDLFYKAKNLIKK